MRYEVLEKFFADSRLHLGLVHVSEQSVERPLRRAMGFREPAREGEERSGQRVWRQPESRPARLGK